MQVENVVYRGWGGPSSYFAPYGCPHDGSCFLLTKRSNNGEVNTQRTEMKRMPPGIGGWVWMSRIELELEDGRWDQLKQ